MFCKIDDWFRCGLKYTEDINHPPFSKPRSVLLQHLFVYSLSQAYIPRLRMEKGVWLRAALQDGTGAVRVILWEKKEFSSYNNCLHLLPARDWDKFPADAWHSRPGMQDPPGRRKSRGTGKSLGQEGGDGNDWRHNDLVHQHIWILVRYSNLVLIEYPDYDSSCSPFSSFSSCFFFSVIIIILSFFFSS